MRNVFAAAVIASLFPIASAEPGLALAPVRSEVAPQADAASMVKPARIYCYDRDTGEFLYWGPCETAASPPPVTVLPRVQCRNRYTGVVDHWASGHC